MITNIARGKRSSPDCCNTGCRAKEKKIPLCCGVLGTRSRCKLRGSSIGVVHRSHTLPPLRTETIVSCNEPEINPICLLKKKVSPSHIEDGRSIWSLERANTRHTKTTTKIRHTVQRIWDPFRTGNAAGFSANTSIFLHKLFTLRSYFTPLSVTQPTPVAPRSKAWVCDRSGSGLEHLRGH